MFFLFNLLVDSNLTCLLRLLLFQFDPCDDKSYEWTIDYYTTLTVCMYIHFVTGIHFVVVGKRRGAVKRLTSGILEI